MVSLAGEVKNALGLCAVATCQEPVWDGERYCEGHGLAVRLIDCGLVLLLCAAIIWAVRG